MTDYNILEFDRYGWLYNYQGEGKSFIKLCHRGMDIGPKVYYDNQEDRRKLIIELEGIYEMLINSKDTNNFAGATCKFLKFFLPEEYHENLRIYYNLAEDTQAVDIVYEHKFKVHFHDNGIKIYACDHLILEKCIWPPMGIDKEFAEGILKLIYKLLNLFQLDFSNTCHNDTIFISSRIMNYGKSMYVIDKNSISFYGNNIHVLLRLPDYTNSENMVYTVNNQKLEGCYILTALLAGMSSEIE